MPFVKIRPLDFDASGEPEKYESVTKSATKLRFKRLFERQSSIVRRDGFEPSSACLSKMVQNFMEGTNEKHRCGRNECICGGNCIDSSEDEFDFCTCFGEFDNSNADACHNLKSLVPCQSVTERNLLADTAKVVDQKKIIKQIDDVCLNIVADGLLALGYDASVCKTHWEKTSACHAGGYEFVDVVVRGERLIVDIDFRSEFEIARATKSYKSILATLPVIFVGKSDRLQKITSIVAEAAKQSLKKKGMPLPPWRKAVYVKAKWLSAYTRISPTRDLTHESLNANVELPKVSLIRKEFSGLESELTLGVQSSGIRIKGNARGGLLLDNNFDTNDKQKMATKMEQPQINFKNCEIGVEKMGGLTCLINDNP